MFFDINESFTSEMCIRQARFNQQPMEKLDSEISTLRQTLHTIPCWDCPAPEDMELAYALQDKIERLSNCADNYERSVDYWNTQLHYARLREEKI